MGKKTCGKEMGVCNSAKSTCGPSTSKAISDKKAEKKAEKKAVTLQSLGANAEKKQAPKKSSEGGDSGGAKDPEKKTTPKKNSGGGEVAGEEKNKEETKKGDAAK